MTRDLSSLGLEDRRSFKYITRRASNRLSVYPSPVKSNFFNNRFDLKEPFDYDDLKKYDLETKSPSIFNLLRKKSSFGIEVPKLPETDNEESKVSDALESNLLSNKKGNG